MKKVIIICKLPPPYLGTTIWAETLRNSSLNKLFNVYYFNNNTHNRVETVGKVRLWGGIANLFHYLRFIFAFISFKPDLVLIPFSQSAWGFIKDSVFMLISRMLGKQPLLMLHGSNFRNWHSQQNGLLKWYCKKVISKSKGIIVLGNNLKYLFADWVGMERVYVVPNGLNLNFPRIEAIHNKKIKITYLGNLQSSKGIEDVVLSLKYLEKKDNIEFHVVGSWRDEKTKLQCLSEKDKYNLPIIFHEAIYGDKKFEILTSSDIFIFPPRMPEGHPLVIVEAMACGLPIISTNQGAIVESVQNGTNGYIVDPYSPKQIAAKIEYLIDHPDIREQMGKESRRIYEENFTEEKMVENLTKVFNQVLQK